MARKMWKILFYLIGILIILISGSKTNLKSIGHLEIPKNLKNVTDQVAKIVCDLKFFIQFYYEEGVKVETVEYLMKKLVNCNISYVIVKYHRYNENIQAIDDDMKLMYALIVLKKPRTYTRLDEVQLNSGQKYRSFYIVFIEDSRGVDKTWLRQIFKQFWKKWVLNVIVIYGSNGTNIYTYNPFENRFLVRLPSYAYSKARLFPFLRIPNMNRHPLKIAIFPEPVRAIFESHRIRGIDGSMAMAIPRKLNASSSFIKPFININGQIYANGTADGNIRLIIEKEIDIALNSRFLLPDKFEKLVESTYVLEKDDICVLVPKAGHISLLFNIFRVFSLELWAFILTTFFATWIFLKVAVPGVPSLFLKIFCWFLNNNTTFFTMNGAVKNLIGLWLLYSLLITSSYKGNLTSHLLAPISHPQIDTMKQLAESEYNILAIDKHARLIQENMNTSVPTERKILRKLRIISEDALNDRLKMNDRTVAYINKHHVVTHEQNSRAHILKNTRIFHVMDECPAHYFSIYAVPYGSPYLGFVNLIVRWSQEHGLALYWTNAQQVKNAISRQAVLKNDKTDPVVLKLQHLQSAFGLLGLGLFISLVVFVGEKIWFKRHRLGKVLAVKPIKSKPKIRFHENVK